MELSTISGGRKDVPNLGTAGTYNTVDAAGITTGYYISNLGVVTALGTYSITGKIPVTEGAKVYVNRPDGDLTSQKGGMYSSGDVWVASIGTSFTIPAGVAYIRINYITANPLIRYSIVPVSYTSLLKITCDGDSITNGSLATKTYPEYLGDFTKSTCINLGVGGDKASNLYARISNTPLDSTKLILNIGFNDYNNSTAIGTLSDSTTATFYGCMNLIIDWYRSNIPLCELYICDLLRSPKTPPDYGGGSSTLEDFHNAIVAVCASKGVRTIPLWNCGMDFRDAALKGVYSLDAIHPNNLGNAYLANIIYKSIQ